MYEILIYFKVMENGCIQLNKNKSYQQLFYSIMLNSNKDTAMKKHNEKSKNWIFSYFTCDKVLEKSTENNYDYIISKNTIMKWIIRTLDEDVSEMIESGLNVSKNYKYDNVNISIVSAEINNIRELKYNKKMSYITIDLETPTVLKVDAEDDKKLSEYIKKYQYDKLISVGFKNLPNIKHINFEIVDSDIYKSSGYFIENKKLLWEKGYKGFLVIKITGKYKETLDFINSFQYIGIGKRNNYGFGFNTIIDIQQNH